MAIDFVRIDAIKRSQAKNAVCKAAYQARCCLQFLGTKFQQAKEYDWSHLEKTAYFKIFLPEHVDEKFKDTEFLWNFVEKFENRKDSQVGFDAVLALPDDEMITLEDKIRLVETFVKIIVSKGYGVQAVIHPPDKKNARYNETTGEKEVLEHNWHAHLLITPRIFNERGDSFGLKTTHELFPNVRGAKHYAIDNKGWNKLWTQIQNDYFESLGLSLRVDPSGIIPQDHLGPIRMRGKKIYTAMSEYEKNISLNQISSVDPKSLLEHFTKTKSIFTSNDVENYFRKHVPENKIAEVRDDFWKNNEVVELFKTGGNQPSDEPRKFSSITVVKEEKKILRLAERVYGQTSLPYSPKKSLEQFTKGLNQEQLEAFTYVIKGKALSCIEGHAGTGKSYLLVALKNFYEAKGYTVRAFGPDSATVEVLKEKGFEDVSNTHKFLFTNYFSKNQIFSKKEVWIVDEAGKLGNTPLLELLKKAEKNGIQLVLSGNSAQPTSVERGGMFKQFCDKYGCVFLKDIQRQKYDQQRKVSHLLASNNANEAINLIAARGGFKWSDSKEEAVTQLIEKWILDRSHHPYSPQLIIANSNAEVRYINEAVHFYRKKSGEIAEKEYECHTSFGNIKVSEGDLIEFRKNDTSLGVSNGMTGVLVSTSDNKFVVKRQEDGKEKLITFDPTKYTSYHLGYATTNFRSQGRTVDRAYVLHSKQINKPLFYVVLTRHTKNVHYFISRTDARCLSDIKFQASREEKKDSSCDYKTHADIEFELRKNEMRNKIEALESSDKLFDRFKGSYLKTVKNLKSQIIDFVEKIQDRRDSKDFYDYVPINEQKGIVFVVEAEEQPSESFNKSTILAESEPQVQEVFSETTFSKLTLSDNQKATLNKYFERVDEASILHSVVKSEAENLNVNEKQAGSFLKWQKACGIRNEEAYKVFHAFSPNSLKQVIGVKSFEILKDRSEKHERHIAPKINIEDNLKGNLEALLYKLFPEGPTRKNAKEFRFGSKCSLAVTYKGSNEGSFFDFENQTGGGLLQLIQLKLGLNKKEAEEWSHNFLNTSKSDFIPKQFTRKTNEKPEEGEWTRVLPPKDHKIPPISSISKHLGGCNILLMHPYYDENRNLLIYVIRFQDKQNPKNKIILPLSYGHSSQSMDLCWRFKRGHFQKNPIYNAQLLNENPNKPILIVEGEKSADAGKMFDQMITISWLGGSGAAKKADWSLLYGRDVIIWPDNDKAGFKAADDISDALRKVGVKSLKVVDRNILSKEFPEKWDIADPLPEGKNIDFLKDCIQRAEPKAVGIDRLSVLLGEKSTDHHEIRKLNEVLWRVDARLRHELENEFKSKTWEIENRIISEVSNVLNSRDELLKMAKQLSGHSEVCERIAFQAMLSEAYTGVKPTQTKSEEIKQAVILCQNVISKPSKFEEKSFEFALAKTCALSLENRVQDKVRIQEYFQSYLSDGITSQKSAVSEKTKSIEMSI